MTAEARHLLMALHDPVGRNDAALARLTASEWDAVAALAIRQGVAPLLSRQSDLPIPSVVRSRLQRRAEYSAFRSLQLQSALRELAAAVRPEGIQLIALKGMHLALEVYPSPALREMADIDVLVQPGNLGGLLTRAAALGYLSAAPMPTASTIQTHHEYQVTRGPVRWDIHWRLSRRGSAPSVETDELLSRSMTLRGFDNVRVLRPGDLFIHVCAHAAGDFPFEQGIRSLCDVMHILRSRSEQLDWHEIIAQSRTWHCEKAVLLTVALAQQYLGLPLPQTLRRYVDSGPPPQDVLRMAADQATAVGPPPAPLAVGRLLGTGTLVRKARQSFIAANLSDDELRLLYPWHRPTVLSRIAAKTARTASLVRRYGWQFVASSVGKKNPVRAAMDRRQTVSEWLLDDIKDQRRG